MKSQSGAVFYSRRIKIRRLGLERLPLAHLEEIVTDLEVWTGQKNETVSIEKCPE
jgi:hypothetical protein